MILPQEMLWPSEKDCPLYAPEFGQAVPAIVPYLHEDDTLRPAMVIFPGGGYEGLAPHEGDGYAKFYFEHGFQCFVVTYRLIPYAHPAMLIDGLRAIRYVRHYAARFHVDPHAVTIIGSSAGGHLAGTCMTHFDDVLPGLGDAIDKENARPDAAILCYGVLSLMEKTHIGTRDNFLGKNPNREELCKAYSAELNIPDNCPPAFIWHTAADDDVLVANSLLTAMAMSEKNIPYSLHIYPFGVHGLGIAADIPLVNEWAPASVSWLHNTFPEMPIEM